MSTLAPTVSPPVVHLNGTSRDDLLKQRYDVLDALHSAGDALAKACPNARDYYPGGVEHIEAGSKQHDRRLGILKDLIAEFQAEIESIQG